MSDELNGHEMPSNADLSVLSLEEAKIEEEIGKQTEFEVGSFYQRAVKQHRILSHEEVLELYKGIRRNDQTCRDKMVLHNLRLVIFYANKYKRDGIVVDDLIQEGTIGLMKAVEKYQPELGYKFSTYALWWIKQVIRRYVQEHGTQVRMPVHIHELRYRIKKIAGELQQKFDRRPTIEEIATEAKCSKEKVVEAFQGVGSVSFSFDQEAFTTNGDPGSTRGELYIDESQKSPVDALLAREGINEIAKELTLLMELLKTVPERKAGMFRSFYGLTDQSTGLYNSLEMVGVEFDLTRERVRQVIELIWHTVKVRAPHLKMNRQMLMDLRQNIALFEEVWEVAKENKDAYLAAARNGQEAHGINGKKRLLPKVPSVVSKSRRLKTFHVRASPAFVRWELPKGKLSHGEILLKFISAAYEVSEPNILGHGKQGQESSWARFVYGYVAAELALDVSYLKQMFVSSYASCVAEGKYVVKKTMGNDSAICEDVVGMVEHIKDKLSVK